MQAQYERNKKAISESFSRAGEPLSNDELLAVYAHFKQAEFGDCKGERPSLFSPKERAKFDAWKALAGMSKETAMEHYVQITNAIFAKRNFSP